MSEELRYKVQALYPDGWKDTWWTNQPEVRGEDKSTRPSLVGIYEAVAALNAARNWAQLEGNGDKFRVVDEHGGLLGASVEGSPDTQQVGGDHYKSKSIQPWDACKAWLSEEGWEGYLTGSVIKYIARWKDKNGVEDLKKCRHFLDKLIEEAEGERT